MNPKLAPTLYIRGLAKLKIGDNSGAADIDAAKTINPKVEAVVPPSGA